MIHLVLGGIRSGKSACGESLARATGKSRIYIATSEPFDEAFRARIQQHQTMRANDGWSTLEVPLDLADAISEQAPGSVVLVECLGVWLGNFLHHGRDSNGAIAGLLEALKGARADIILVSSEVGLGLVADTKLGRTFCDLLGGLNQNIATLATHVTFVAAGLPLVLKAPPPQPE